MFSESGSPVMSWRRSFQLCINIANVIVNDNIILINLNNMDQIQIQHSSTNCSASVWNQKVDPICYCVAEQCLMPDDIVNGAFNDILKASTTNLSLPVP